MLTLHFIAFKVKFISAVVLIVVTRPFGTQPLNAATECRKVASARLKGKPNDSETSQQIMSQFHKCAPFNYKNRQQGKGPVVEAT